MFQVSACRTKHLCVLKMATAPPCTESLNSVRYKMAKVRREIDKGVTAECVRFSLVKDSPMSSFGTAVA